MRKILLATMVAVAMSAVDAPPARAQPQPAAWKAQKLHFDYLGFTTRYSCQGLATKIRLVLRRLQAQKGFKVAALGCDGDKPVRLPSVDIELATLQPTDAPGAIDAAWSRIDLGAGAPLDRGDCELSEQIVKQILPLFTVRNVHLNTVCTPHQVPTGALSLTLEALVPATPIR